jgi:nitronate monooxygenase
VISGRPARLIRNRLLDDLLQSGLKPLPIPKQLSLTMPLGASGDREMTALFAGQSAGMVRHRTAADLVETLAADALRRLRSFAL